MKVSDLIRENRERNQSKNAPYDPYTGENAPLDRVLLEISDFYLPKQFIPIQMADIPLVKGLSATGSIIEFLKLIGEDATDENRSAVSRTLIMLRNQHDFYYWAASFAKIKNKEGGGNIPFILNRAQRRLILSYEKMRLAGKPIRVILLKARQW